MSKLNWEKAASSSRYRIVGRDMNECEKQKKITNKQKKFIALLMKQQGIKWSNAINSLTREDAASYINILKK